MRARHVCLYVVALSPPVLAFERHARCDPHCADACSLFPRVLVCLTSGDDAVHAAVTEAAAWALDALSSLVRADAVSAMAVSALGDSGTAQAFVDACLALALPVAALATALPALAAAMSSSSYSGADVSFCFAVLGRGRMVAGFALVCTVVKVASAALITGHLPPTTWRSSS